MKFDKLVLLSMVLCAVVLAGELMAYGPSVHNYSADAQIEEGSFNISVSASDAENYSAIIMDNGAHPAPTQIYIYLDDRYNESLRDVTDAIGLKGIDMGYAIDQMCKLLKIRGFDNIQVCDDEQLLNAMTEDMNGPMSKGLLVMSYALPESIYSGSADSLLFDWMGHGGSLYWMSSPIGMFYHGENGLVTVENSQELFFGKDCMNMAFAGLALSAIDAGGLTEALALKWNRVLYGLDTSGMDGAVALGFSQDGYSSVSMVPFGNGMICVAGGIYDRYQREDMAQLIASGITCYSQILEIRSGDVIRGTAEFSCEVPDGSDGLSAYVYLGGYYVVYGRSFVCSAV